MGIFDKIKEKKLKKQKELDEVQRKRDEEQKKFDEEYKKRVEEQRKREEEQRKREEESKKQWEEQWEEIERKREEEKRKQEEEQRKREEEERKKREEEKRKREEEKRKREEEERKKREEEESKRLENKPLEWFYSEEGVKALEERITPKKYLENEEFSMACDDDTPSAYFEAFINSIKNVEMLEFEIGWKTQNVVANCLFNQANPISYDEDGEPKLRESVFNSKDILSFEKNPVLYFVKNFKGFSFYGEKDVYELFRKSELILEAIAFVYYESEDEEIISKNQWLFDSSSYLNDLGTFRDYKSFFKKGIELSSNPDYFKNLLENQNSFTFKYE